MLTKRIIPCLDIKDGRTVKGVNFENIRDAGDPIELAKLYVQQKADELVFFGYYCHPRKRKTLVSPRRSNCTRNQYTIYRRRRNQ